MKKVSVILLAVVALVSACSKEEPPPNYKAMLARTWKQSKITINGQPATINLNQRSRYSENGTGISYNLAINSGIGSEENPIELIWSITDDGKTLTVQSYSYSTITNPNTGQLEIVKGNLQSANIITVLSLSDTEFVSEVTTTQNDIIRVTQIPAN